MTKRKPGTKRLRYTLDKGGRLQFGDNELLIVEPVVKGGKVKVEVVTPTATLVARLKPRGQTMKYWWVSWAQPTADYRPMTWPPPDWMLGFWCSGFNSDDQATLVVWLKAESEEAAKKQLASPSQWPEFPGTELRFIEERVQSWRPSDRFPIPEWSPFAVDTAPPDSK